MTTRPQRRFGAALLGACVAAFAGLTATALGGSGTGATFNLGRTNSVAKQTVLTGSPGRAPMLMVRNRGRGPAFAAVVRRGAPPFRVNSRGKVANLNADLLDGLDSGGFYRAGSKVADANELDGVDGAGYQRRVSGTCAAGSAVRVVNADGTVACESFPASWSLTGNAGTTPTTHYLGTTDAQPLVVKTNNAEALRVDPNGRVGIGTTSPLGTLDVTNSGAGDVIHATATGGSGRALVATAQGNAIVASSPSAAAIVGVSSTSTGLFGQSESGSAVHATSNSGTGVFANSNTGNIFVGAALLVPKARIDNTGKGFFNGGTQTGGADYAESLRASEGTANLEPGDVLALDPRGGPAVRKSRGAYSTRVAGVYSTKPALLAVGEHRINDSLIGEVPVALMGIVPTKVSAENGRIRVGDLLTTARTAGHAMKAKPIVIRGVEIYPTGAILGKALQPLRKGKGTIKVLVMLR